MKKIAITLALAIATLAGGAAWSQTSKDLSEAEIRKIDKDAKKITLKHGPIKNLDMPAMTMVFQIRDAALLDKLTQLKVGDKILFSAEQQLGTYIVTGAEKAGTN